jgi:hypothetical protein
MNAIIPATSGGGSGMIPTDMGAAMRLAEMMSTGRLVPAHLQKSPGDCLMVVELAMRFRMSPFAVAQCTSVIQGKLMLEGKLVGAAVNCSGVLEDRLAYDFAGANDTRAVTVKGTIRGEAEPREMTVTLREAKTTNALWTKQPDQQLVYFATRAWARRHTPEVMLGVYSPEEFAGDSFSGPTIEHTAPEPAAPPAAKAEPPKQPAKPTVAGWLDALALELAAAADMDAVDEILARPEVQQAQDRLRNGARDRLQHILDEAITRTARADDAAEAEAGDALFANPADDPFRELTPT